MTNNTSPTPIDARYHSTKHPPRRDISQPDAELLLEAAMQAAALGGTSTIHVVFSAGRVKDIYLYRHVRKVRRPAKS